MVLVSADSNGYTSCDDDPRGPHYTGFQTGTGPATIQLLQAGAPVTSWTAGQTYQVCLASTTSYKGFIIAPFKASKAALGTAFTVTAKAGTLASTDTAPATGSKPMAGACAPGQTQRSATDKTANTFNWTPPAAGSGAVTFYSELVVAWSTNWRVYLEVPEGDAAASPSPTASLSATASPAAVAVSPSSSPVAASPSGSLSPAPALPSLSPSLLPPTGSSSAAAPATSTGTQSATASLSSTRSRSPSATPTRTGTRPPTSSSSPLCRAPVVNVSSLHGVSGSVPAVDVGRYGNTGMYTSGSCAAGFQPLFPGPRAVFLLDLGSGMQLGGSLTVTTCGATADDTVIYVGTGCPTWYLPFACRAGNDNAGDAAGQVGCDVNPLASTVTLTATTARVYYVQLGGYLGAPVVSGLSWRYEPPRLLSATRMGSATSSRSRTQQRPATALATASRTTTRSRTRKPK